MSPIRIARLTYALATDWILSSKLALALLLMAMPLSIANAAPVQWKAVDGGNGHFYEAIHVPGGISWSDARLAAISKGGHLATITSAAENQFVFELILDDSFWTGDGLEQFVYGPWLGAQQQPGSSEPDGGWSWVTGETFQFTSWFSGEPSNTNGIEDALHFINRDLSSTGPWNDWSSSGQQLDGVNRIWGYVVESDVPEPGASQILLMSILSLQMRRRGLL